jgi:hypothetical protein
MVKNKSHMKRLAQNLFVLSVLAGLPANSTQLKASINWRHVSVWITSGMRSKKVTAALSKHCRQKATKTAFTGLLIKTNTYVNPEYSFADCDTDTVITSVQEHKKLPGCRNI